MNDNKVTVGRVISIIILTLWAVSALLPFLWMVSTSLKDAEVIHAFPIEWVPKHPGFSAFEEIFNLKMIPFGKAVSNSLIIAAIITFFTVMFPAMAAFVFAKIPFRGREKVFLLFLVSMMIPGSVTLIPNFILIRTIKLTNTILGVALPFTINAFGIFLIRQAMKGIDNAYIEAALMDGATLPRIFFKIMLPMVKPTVMTLVLLQFMFAWNSYMWPLVVLPDENRWTLQIALANMQSQYGNDENILMAGALITMTPMIIMYLITQRYIHSGILIGGIKG